MEHGMDEHPMAFVDVQSQEASSDLPTYILRPESVYYVPFFHIDRDHNKPVVIRSDVWNRTQAQHGQFNALSCLLNTTVSAENIVVISSTPTGEQMKPDRIHWFVRLAIEGGHSRFANNFGQNFLWQLPYGTCTKIIHELRSWALAKGLPESPLASAAMMPTPHNFNAKHVGWSGLKTCDRFTDYYDAMFAAMVSPSEGSVGFCSLPNKNSLMSRPLRYRTFRNSPLDFSTGLPDDVIDLIFQHSAGAWISSSDPSNWESLLAIRCVSRAARASVDTSAASFMKKLAAVTKQTQTYLRVSNAETMRNEFKDSGIPVLKFLCDTRSLDIINLMRLRTNKPANSVPPSRQAAEAQRRRLNATRSLEMLGTGIASKAWIQMQRVPTAFESRKAKRQKVLKSAGVI